MLNAQKSVKLCIILTDIFICALVILTVLLPFGVSWYVETMHRSQTLPATIMITCYPCAPFLGILLFMLRRVLKRIIKGDIFINENSHDLKIITCCCIVIALITLIAGRYYIPFYIVGLTFVFLALITYAANSVFLSVYEKKYSENDNNN